MSPTPADATYRREVLRDLATGALSLVLAGGLAIAHHSQSGRLHEDYGREPGPALLPELLLAALALAGAGMLLRGLFGYWRARPLRAHGDVDKNFRSLATPSAIVGLLLVFLFAYRSTGFGLAVVVLGIAVATVLARQEHGAIRRAALEGALIAVALYALFRFVLSVPLS